MFGREQDKPRAASKRVFVVGLAVSLLLSVVVQICQLLHYGVGNDSDAEIYLDYAAQWADGRTPYVDFAPEYPAGSLYLFLVPRLTHGAAIDDYRVGFAW